MRIAIFSRPARLVSAVLLVAGVAACSTYNTNITELDEDEFAEFLGIDLTQMTLTASGLYLLDTEVGTGDPAVEGLLATVLIQGWLRNGVLWNSGQLQFVIEPQPEVLPGILEGTLGMRVGGVRKLVVPPALGFGSEGSGVVPPDATLVIEVTLLGLQVVAP